MSDAPTFEEVWPEVSRRVAAFLRSRGFTGDLCDEAVQEAAARFVERDVPYDDADDLFRWVSTVAYRAALDDRRRSRRLGAGVPDRAAPCDLVGEVVDRLYLRAVQQAVAQLSPSERFALFDRGVPISRNEAVRLATRRYRARLRLKQLTERALGVFGPLLRWLRDRALPALLPGCAALVLPLAIAIGGDGEDGDRRSPRRGSAAAVSVDGAGSGPAQRLLLPPFQSPVQKARGVADGEPPRSGADLLPPVLIAVPIPGAGDATVEGRPMEPDDSLVCTGPHLSLIEKTCVDSMELPSLGP